MSNEEVDPELVEDEQEDDPAAEAEYDGQAVEFANYDPTQFELSDDFEWVEDEGDEDG